MTDTIESDAKREAFSQRMKALWADEEKAENLKKKISAGWSDAMRKKQSDRMKKRNRAKSKLTPAKLRRARELLKTHTAVEVAKKLGVHRSSLYKALKGFEAPTSPEL